MLIQVPCEAILEGPHITWAHIDGPLLSWAGEMHWLTLGERAALALRLTSVERIACARFPLLDGKRKTLRNQINIDALLSE